MKEVEVGIHHSETLPLEVPYSELIKGFELFLRRRGRFPATVDAYLSDARIFLDYCRDHKVILPQFDLNHFAEYLAWLINTHHIAHNSRRRAIIAVRQFFKFMFEEKWLSLNHLEGAIVPPRDESLAEPLSLETIESLCTACLQDTHPLKGNRDAAVLRLLAWEGVKANEIIHLKWCDLAVLENTGYLFITGRKSRTITLEPTTLQSLLDYQLKYRAFVPSSEERGQKMFIGFKGRGGAVPLASLSRHGLKFSLYEMGNRANLSGLNTEMLRHVAIEWQLSQGKSPERVMAHLGLNRLGNISKHLRRAVHG